jgi:hypothetical protein
VSVAAIKQEIVEIRASLNLSVGRRLDTVAAADFVTGGRADFARACSTKGDVVELVRSEPGEPYDAFLERARSRAIGLGAPRLVFGGLAIPPSIPRLSSRLLRPRSAGLSSCPTATDCTQARRKRRGRS